MKPKRKIVVAIDFDSTIVHIDQPIYGAKDAINLLREKGYYILIHSCNHKQWIERILNDNDIRFDYICENDGGKPVADIYIDDKGYHFKGDWPTEVNEIIARLEK